MFVTIDGQQYTVHEVYCCRPWIVLSQHHIGRCDYCGQIPTIEENHVV